MVDLLISSLKEKRFDIKLGLDLELSFALIVTGTLS